ncbi:PilZ domain-containing protein [Geodermatophilus sp. DF01-2]|uniref:flagellar brake protein n=1 Tax=Geodermatophilus sp. DF01-2 TaxID=2559610 RepID=UPI0010737920|nr:PilZ domain-containing protein [Geodermatophilus sp. DF01_2]TFV54727.1 PilZ domain-containing protein [Geodermatophilus sp. DF01_2]
MDTGVTRPEANAEAEVTHRDHPVSVSTRVERADAGTLVVRPSVSEFVEQQVVRVGDPVRVFWRDSISGWALPAEVSTVERGAVPRWHLAVVGPAEPMQRREAVRVRLALPLTAGINGADLEGEVLDLSEGGVRVVMDAFGNPPLPGSVVPLTVHLEDGAIAARAEVVRHQTRGARWGMSLRFVGLPEKEQDRLRRRVFQAMREERARAGD